MGNFIKIQQELVKKYNIIIERASRCVSRTHAHVKQRQICKWDYKNSIENTFTLAHEIGHIETTKSRMRRAESEYYATEWAINELQNNYGLKIPEKTIKSYQRYIDMELDRGIRRGGNDYDIPRTLASLITK